MRSFETVKEKLKLLWISAGIIVLDQIVKKAISGYQEHEVIIEVEPFFQIIRTQNRGAAFSLLNGRIAFLLITTACMLVGILLAIIRVKEIGIAGRVSLAVLLGGGAGNWLDRFAAGAVTDYIRLMFMEFPVFNIADICITASVAALMLLLLTGRFEIHTGENNGTGH